MFTSFFLQTSIRSLGGEWDPPLHAILAVALELLPSRHEWHRLGCQPQTKEDRHEDFWPLTVQTTNNQKLNGQVLRWRQQMCTARLGNWKTTLVTIVNTCMNTNCDKFSAIQKWSARQQQPGPAGWPNSWTDRLFSSLMVFVCQSFSRRSEVSCPRERWVTQLHIVTQFHVWCASPNNHLSCKIRMLRLYIPGWTGGKGISWLE